MKECPFLLYVVAVPSIILSKLQGLWLALLCGTWASEMNAPYAFSLQFNWTIAIAPLQLLELRMGNSNNCNGASDGNVESVHARSHNSILHLSLFAQQAEPAAMCRPFPLHIFALCISQLAKLLTSNSFHIFQSDDSLHTGPRHHPSFFFLQHRPH